MSKVKEILDTLASFSDPGEGVTRLAFGEQEDKAFAWFSRQLCHAGAAVYADGIGNLFGRWGPNGTPRLLIGSHIDSVPGGGRFDGTVGAALALVAIREAGPDACELALFRAEESARFGKGLIGSAYACGSLSNADTELKDAGGVRLSAFLPSARERAYISPARHRHYMEVHIEQGPVLAGGGLAVGVVSGIAAPVRFRIEIAGPGGHSGTVPMPGRRDPLVTAARLILAVQSLAAVTRGAVGTVGRVEVPGGAMNKIPSLCILHVDLRADTDESLTLAEDRLRDAVSDLCAGNRTSAEIICLDRGTPAPLLGANGYFARACAGIGEPFVVLPSGAGHDALNVAHTGVPSEMLFIRSVGGVSHCPEEFTSDADLEVALRVLTEAIRQEQAAPPSRAAA